MVDLFKRKKHVRGIPDKPRTRKEVEQEYSHYCIMHGHTARIIADLRKSLEENLNNLKDHEDALVRLANESKSLPPDSEPPTPATPEKAS